MLHFEDIVYRDGIAEYFSRKITIARRASELFLFGSARSGERVYEYLKRYDLEKKVSHVIDNDTMKQGKSFNGIIIESADILKDLVEKSKDARIIIASGSAHIIRNQLLEYGIPENIMETFVLSNLEVDANTPFSFFSERKEQIERVYHLLADDRSKDVFISLLNYKMTRDPKWLFPIAEDEHLQYFDSVMQISQSECFVDCGAFIGDTLDEFNRVTNGSWERYYCFEADAAVFKKLNMHIDKCKYLDVETYNIGCWDKEEKLYFENQGSGSSKIVEKDNGVEIHADKLDHILSGKNISIIKMDIEGAEKKALLGARSIIKEQHPRLAISIYHSLEDFIELPEIMGKYWEGYKIYVRHYRELSDSETICYAV